MSDTLQVRFTDTDEVQVTFKTVPSLGVSIPAPHAPTHKSGGSDPISIDEFAAATDNTNLNVSLTAHGLMPKLAGGTRKFYRSDGAQAFVGDVVNVRDYGAVGDGVTNDDVAVGLAVAALTSYSALYFPPGKYRTVGTGWVLGSMTNVKVFGDAAEIYNDSGAAGQNTFVVNTTCDHVEFHDISFTGSSSVRANGIHIRLYSNNSGVYDCEFSGCSDFGVHIGLGTGYQANVEVIGNVFNGTLGDGVHVGGAVLVLIEGNLFNNTYDDAIGIVADDPAFPPNRILVVGNNIYNAGISGVSGCGIRVCEAVDVSIIGNRVYNTKESGICTHRFLSTTAYNTRIFIAENTVLYACQTAGPLGGIVLEFINDSIVHNNRVEGTANGGGISFLDFTNLVITDNTIKTCPGRGIASDDGTSTNVAANWNRLTMKNNIVEQCGTGGVAQEAYYITPIAGKTISNIIVDGNVANDTPGANYIFTNRLGGLAKVVNNTSLEGLAVANGGTGTVPTTANNN